MDYIEYGETETEYLSRADERMAALIKRAGHVYRPCVDGTLYSAVVDSIIGQQIATKAHATIRARIKERYGILTPEKVASLSDEELQSVGTTFRKVAYIKNFTQMVLDGEMNPAEIEKMSDVDVINELVKIKGIGVWTAEMLLTFLLKRRDVISYGDLAIRRGIMKLYNLDNLSEEKFHEITDKFSPYRTIRRIYIWRYANPACTFTVQ